MNNFLKQYFTDTSRLTIMMGAIILSFLVVLLLGGTDIALGFVVGMATMTWFCIKFFTVPELKPVDIR